MLQTSFVPIIGAALRKMWDGDEDVDGHSVFGQVFKISGICNIYKYRVYLQLIIHPISIQSNQKTSLHFSFHQDLEAFVQHQERDRKPFLANDAEIDGLVIILQKEYNSGGNLSISLFSFSQSFSSRLHFICNFSRWLKRFKCWESISWNWTKSRSCARTFATATLPVSRGKCRARTSSVRTTLMVEEAVVEVVMGVGEVVMVVEVPVSAATAIVHITPRSPRMAIWIPSRRR